ncbi:MAG TPA: hypothetical protein VJ001_17635 [Rhodocyclaceae bacterium]|nr:hypothetical protein [Rhodocyclaceae bacterium]
MLGFIVGFTLGSMAGARTPRDPSRQRRLLYAVHSVGQDRSDVNPQMTQMGADKVKSRSKAGQKQVKNESGFHLRDSASSADHCFF